MFKSFSLNLSIKKDIMIIDERGIKNTDDLQGNMSARLLISTKYYAESVANGVLENIGARFLNFGNDAALMSESANYNEQTRSFTASQSYSQDLTNTTYNTNTYRYIKIR